MSTLQLPLAGNQGIAQPGDSDTGADASQPFYMNGYFEKYNSPTESRKYSFVKRPGLGQTVNSGWMGGADLRGYNIQGTTVTADHSTVMWFANNGLACKYGYFSGGVTPSGGNGTPPAASGNWTFTGPVVFTSLDVNIYNSNVFAVTDFTKGAVINASFVWAEITDADFTGLTKITNFEAMDGYLFIGDNRNRIYNSDLNTPATWTSTSFLTAGDIPGRLVWLKRIRNYLLVFKEYSVEFFEDIGNPTPGSPLEARKQLTIPIGCLSKQSIQTLRDGSVIFVGNTKNGTSRVYRIDPSSLTAQPISDRFIEQGLPFIGSSTLTTYNIDPSIDLLALGQSQLFTWSGKEFYMITLPLFDGSKRSFVYDVQDQFWYVWTTSISTTATIDGAGFGGYQAVTYSLADVGGLLVPIFFSNLLVSGSVAPSVYYVNPLAKVYTDGSTHSYIFAWTSDILDMGNRRRKFMDSLEILYTSDISLGGPVASGLTFTINCRDYDYNQSSVMSTRSVVTGLSGGGRCYISRMGSFRRRVISMNYTGAQFVALWAVEIGWNQGETDSGPDS